MISEEDVSSSLGKVAARFSVEIAEVKEVLKKTPATGKNDIVSCPQYIWEYV
ncbi:hypothetical protein [Peribacillus sp. SCS-155]|uniref:hypothetical protein n=1 Tax=Peribacillus sedimenti TaxID=3115297 RepID=UPI003905AB99